LKCFPDIIVNRTFQAESNDGLTVSLAQIVMKL